MALAKSGQPNDLSKTVPNSERRSFHAESSIFARGALFCVVCFRTVSAHSKSAGAQKWAMVAKHLILTPDQRAKLLPLLEAEVPKIKALKANTSLLPMQKLDQLCAIHQQADPQVQSILPPQQYAKWEEIRGDEVMQILQQKKEAQQ